jgi:hypothetical protein
MKINQRRRKNKVRESATLMKSRSRFYVLCFFFAQHIFFEMIKKIHRRQ